MQGEAGLTSGIRGWPVPVGLGLLAGGLLGAGMTGDHTHAAWPVLAGLVLGVAGAFAIPSRPVLVAACGSGVAVAAAVALIVMVQVQRGHWPITDEFTIAHYGTGVQAALRAALLLAALVGIPCVIAAVLIAVARAKS